MNYQDLTSSISSWAENYDPVFTGQINTIIKQAENRIVTAVRLPAFSSTLEMITTAGSITTTAPSDLVSVDSLAFDGERPLLKKDPEFIYEAYQGIVGPPRFFGLRDSTTIVWGPIPDQAYPFSLRYFSYPQSIVTFQDGTYISNTFPAALLSGCLWMASMYMKDWEGATVHQQQFLQALGNSAKVAYGAWQKQTFEKNSAAVDSAGQLGQPQNG